MTEANKSIFLRGLRNLALTTALASSPLAAATTPTSEALPEDITATALTEATRGAIQMAADYQARSLGEPIIVIHADTYDVLRAAGLDGPDALRHIAGVQGLRPSPELLVQIAQEVDNRAPHAFLAPNTTADGKTACLVISSETLPSLLVEGFTRDQMVRFTNRHEFQHCTDPHFKMAETPKDVDLEKERKDLEKGHFSHFALQSAAETMRHETLADLGAVGDMIAKDGDSIDIIDTLADFRQKMLGNRLDIGHYSSPGLKALRAQIEDMGIDTFRALPQDKREEMYQRITAETSPSPFALRAFVAIITEKTSLGRAERKARSDAEDAMGVEIYHAFKEGARRHTSQFSPRTLAFMHQENILDYDAQEELLSRARDEQGRVTPQSLTRARSGILDDLLSRMDEKPNDPSSAAKSVKLRETYAELMRNPLTFAPAAPAATSTAPAAQNPH